MAAAAYRCRGGVLRPDGFLLGTLAFVRPGGSGVGSSSAGGGSCSLGSSCGVLGSSVDLFGWGAVTLGEGSSRLGPGCAVGSMGEGAATSGVVVSSGLAGGADGVVLGGAGNAQQHERRAYAGPEVSTQRIGFVVDAPCAWSACEVSGIEMAWRPS